MLNMNAVHVSSLFNSFIILQNILGPPWVNCRPLQSRMVGQSMSCSSVQSCTVLSVLSINRETT